MGTRILILDNYDSFTYNLAELLRRLGENSFAVIRNDKLTLEEVKRYERIILSPGPGIPEEAGLMPLIIKTYAPQKSILGVCLGHQGIAESFGGKLFNMKDVVHGKGSRISVLEPQSKLFRGIAASFVAGRYHSWAVSSEDFPSSLKITAVDEEGTIMALQHKEYDVHGVQFHPESVLTECGEQILTNWLSD